MVHQDRSETKGDSMTARDQDRSETKGDSMAMDQDRSETSE
jgi:hypothetical protein